MLTRYTIKNYKSFKNKVCIDFKSTNYKILSNTNVFENSLLKGMLFVGANASGKTNIILALKTLLDLLFSDSGDDNIFLKCLFSEDENVLLDYEFLIDGHNVQYQIKYSDSNGFDEKLLLDSDEILIRIGKTGTFKINKEEHRYDDIDKESLLLREIYFNTRFRGNDTLKSWFVFLKNSAYVNLYNKNVVTPGSQLLLLYDYLKDKGVGDLNNFFEKLNFDYKIEYEKRSLGKSFNLKLDEKLIFFRRNGIDEPIPYPIESVGNQTLLNILPAFLHVIKNGGILMVDEFSSGFHNDLEELLIKYFMKNSEKSQIVFVSHSTNLLSNSILRPDQIYSVDFRASEGSVIKRFSSEKPREAQNMEKMYNSGIFDGLPQYNEI